MAAKKITLTETTLSATDAEVLACYLAAKRAQRQAEAIIAKLQKRVLKLAKQHPALLFDGARITCGKQVVWSYDCEPTIILQHQLSQAEKQDRFEGRANARTVEFPQVRELSKMTNQVPEKHISKSFTDLFTNWRK